jgi:hypothetical protein
MALLTLPQSNELLYLHPSSCLTGFKMEMFSCYGWLQVKEKLRGLFGVLETARELRARAEDVLSQADPGDSDGTALHAALQVRGRSPTPCSMPACIVMQSGWRWGL